MRRLALAGSIVWLGLSLSAASRAQDTADLDALLAETVSSTASKSAEASTVVPAHTLNITAEDLRRHGIRTLAGAYNFLGLGIIAEDPLGDAEVGSRGVLFTNDAGKHVLLLIDGHVTNDQRNGASYHSRAAGIPIELIDHIEIMLGPGSVLYGANATLGVVNVVTKRARDFTGVRVVAETTLAPAQNRAHQPILQLDGLGTAYRVGVGMGETFKLFGETTEVTGQIEYYQLSGPRLGWTPIRTGNFNYGPNAPIGTWGGETQQSYYQKLPTGYLRVRSGDFQLTLHGVLDRSSVPYSRIQDFNRDFDDPASYTDRTYAAVDLSWTRVVSSRTSLTARVYGDASEQYTQLRTSSFIGCPSSLFNGCTHTFDGHARWLGGELQASIKWLSDLSMSTLLGVEGRLRAVGFESGLKNRFTAVKVSTFDAYDANAVNGALYAQQVYSPTSSVTLNAGARGDFDDRFGQRLSPRAAMAVDVWPGGTAKAIYSEAFRAPTVEELHLTNRFLVLSAPSLEPEIVHSAEALLQQRVGTQRTVVGVFGSRWSDVVFRQRISQAQLSVGQREGVLDSSTVNVYQFRNVARVESYGVNASYEGSVFGGRLSYGANFTAAYSRVKAAGTTRPLTVIPSVYGNARVAYDLQDSLPVVAFTTQLSGRRLADNAFDVGVTRILYASPTAELRLTFSGEMPEIPALQYRLSGDYAFTTTNPYAVNVGSADRNLTQLVPASRAQLLLGLQYQF